MKEEGKKRFFSKAKLKRIFRKSWVLPSLYVTGIALLLTAAIWYQLKDGFQEQVGQDVNYEVNDVAGSEVDDELAVQVTNDVEKLALPTIDGDGVVIKQGFYDGSLSEEAQEAALVSYNNQYHPNKGLNLGREDGESFPVTAALSGKVLKVVEDPLLGNLIEIGHENGIVTHYQALTDISVAVNDQVKQGETIAKAGRSQFNEAAGVHVHFELRKDSQALNPEQYLNQSIATIGEAKDGSEEEEELDREQEEN